MLPDDYIIGEENESWCRGVIDNVHTKDITLDLSAGLNELKIFARSPGFVLEKTVIFPEGKEPPHSYLGPLATYRITE